MQNHISETPQHRYCWRRIASILALLALSSVSLAQNTVVVIPMSGDDLNPLANIVTVAKANGDFSDPVAAMQSIPSTGPNAPSASNRYLVVVAPGEYVLTERLEMRQYVSISGSGRQATILRGSLASGVANETAALVQGARFSEISDMSIEHEAQSGTHAIGIYNNSDASNATLSNLSIMVQGASTQNIGILNAFAAPLIREVEVTADGVGQAASQNIAVSNQSSPVTIRNLTASAFRGARTIALNNPFSAVRLRNATLTAVSGSASNTGIYNEDPFFTHLRDTRISVGGGSGSNYGISNNGAEPAVSNVTISVFEGANSYGIYNYNGAAPILTETDVTAESATVASYGLYVVSGVTRARRSSFTATTDAVYAATNGDAIISNSQVTNGNVGGPGDITCLNSSSDTGTITELDGACDT